MDFNSILIGSEDAPRLIEYYTRLFGEPQMADETYERAGPSVAASWASGRTRR